ncbi:hypothetical protein HPB47_017039 [Ixodes persulcatus]|uniref:Uncharacterized protein n=1 Tax=Ixodes persulcatus TaxID=34615 RepID=A0AC60QPB5_IXOPE|nr:hypothetical protein HPB47_017039 [Ixodes persulcatus]
MSDVATTSRVLALFAAWMLSRDRVFRDRFHPFDVFDEEGLQRRFRFGRDGIMYIADVLASDLTRLTRPAEVPELQGQFYAVDGFPGVVGTIDGIHVRIQGPPLHEELVVDARSRILNVVAKWPGSVHDSYVLSQSSVGENFATGAYGGLLIGDSGYPCRPWLMAPFRSPTTRAECAYNQTHAATRSVVER